VVLKSVSGVSVVGGWFKLLHLAQVRLTLELGAGCTPVVQRVRNALHATLNLQLIWSCRQATGSMVPTYGLMFL